MSQNVVKWGRLAGVVAAVLFVLSTILDQLLLTVRIARAVAVLIGSVLLGVVTIRAREVP